MNGTLCAQMKGFGLLAQHVRRTESPQTNITFLESIRDVISFGCLSYVVPSTWRGRSAALLCSQLEHYNGTLDDLLLTRTNATSAGDEGGSGGWSGGKSGGRGRGSGANGGGGGGDVGNRSGDGVVAIDQRSAAVDEASDAEQNVDGVPDAYSGIDRSQYTWIDPKRRAELLDRVAALWSCIDRTVGLSASDVKQVGGLVRWMGSSGQIGCCNGARPRFAPRTFRRSTLPVRSPVA